MLKSDDNFYEPAYFFIKLNTDKKLQEIIDTPVESTLIHEYVHLLQDISLVCNRNMMCQNVRHFRAFARELRVKGNFKRPLDLTDHNDKINDAINSYLWGEKVFISIATVENIELKDNYICEGIPVKDIILHCFDNDHNKLSYRVGRHDFMESMAFAIENHIYNTGELPDFPYRTIHKILEFYKIDSSNYIVSQICELALSSFTPIENFLLFLDRFNRSNKNLDTQSIYSMMYDNITITNFDGSTMTKEEFVKNSFSESKAMIGELFADPFFSDIRSWINEFFDMGANYRNSDCVYISNIINNPPSKAKEIIRRHIMSTGIPAIYNNQYLAQQINPHGVNKNTTAFNLIALKEVYRYITTTQLHCNLTSFCSRSPSALVDNNCYSDIMQQINRPGLCPFGVWIKALGFQDLQ
jgi:hypothetical protein